MTDPSPGSASRCSASPPSPARGEGFRAPSGAFLGVGLLAFVAGPWPAAAQQPPPNLDHRKIVADNVATLFSADAHAHNIMVSELRRVPSALGLVWATCVRASVSGMGGKPIPPRTYLVTFTARNTIAERSAATGEQCAGARFEPLR